jgi:hypothetical protein
VSGQRTADSRQQLEVSAADRVVASLVTGPVGRVVAFAADLAAALGSGALNKLSRR